MANRTTFYFKQVLRKEDLNTEFDNLEAAQWNLAADFGLVGIASGGLLAVNVSSAAHATIDTILATTLDGKRLSTGGPITVDFTKDVTGTPTVPSSGHFRWISILARYGKDGTNVVTDGDGATVYTTETEGISSTGDVDAAHSPSNFGQFRIVSGTEAASTGAAARPSGFGSDILICDLLLDDTGLVHGAMAGASVTRASRFAVTQAGAKVYATRFETHDYALVRDINVDGARGIHLREYVGIDTGTCAFLTTLNAQWDGTQQLWLADDATVSAHMIEMYSTDQTHNVRTSGGTSWTNDRNNPVGWDVEWALLLGVPNSRMTVDSSGPIVSNGPQIGFGLVRTGEVGTAPSTYASGVTWAQQMAATPSSTTLADISSVDQNVGSVGVMAVNVFGCGFEVTSAGGTAAAAAVVAARKITTVP